MHELIQASRARWDYHDAFTLPISVMLSGAQTDAAVTRLLPELFRCWARRAIRQLLTPSRPERPSRPSASGAQRLGTAW